MNAAPLAWAQVVARNVVPLAGVLLLGWSAPAVLVLYFVDTLLALAVIFAGVLRALAPPVTDEGWATRVNGEVGMVAGGLACAAVVAIPLGVPLVFMIGGVADSRALIADPQLRAGLAWQALAALWAYVGLYRALHHASAESLQLKRRFALVFLRWFAMVIVALSGVGMLFGRQGALLFVALHAVVSVFAEIAPDRFLRLMPGGAEHALPALALRRAVAPPPGRRRRKDRRR